MGLAAEGLEAPTYVLLFASHPCSERLEHCSLRRWFGMEQPSRSWIRPPAPLAGYPVPWASCLSIRLSPQLSFLRNSVHWARTPPPWERPWLYPQHLRCLPLSLTPARLTCIRMLVPAPYLEISANNRQTVRPEMDDYTCWELHAPDMPSVSERPSRGLVAWLLCVSTVLGRPHSVRLHPAPGWAFEP